MVKRSKWCSSSMCSRLTGTPSDTDATVGDQSISRGMDVGDGESSLVRLRDSGGVRTQRSHLLTQLPHGSPSSHWVLSAMVFCLAAGQPGGWQDGNANPFHVEKKEGVGGGGWGVTDLDLAPLAAYTPKP